MKTYKHLVEFATSDRILEEALDKATIGKRKRRDVRYIYDHLKEAKAWVRKMIMTKSYPSVSHHAHVIHQPTNHKERIVVPPHISLKVPEQWLHHILIKTIGHILLKGVYFHSHASIPGRGVFSAKKYIERYIKRHQSKARYFLKLDIKKFYQNIDTDLLKKKVAKKIRDPYIIALVNWVIDNNRVIMPDKSVQCMGLLLGFYTSQYFANYYLQDLDHYIKEQLKAPFYARYMDDMIIIHSNKRKLAKIRDAIVEKVHSEHLQLKKNPEIQTFQNDTPCSLIGFKFYKNRTTLKPEIIYRARRTAKKIHRFIAKHHELDVHDAMKMVSYIGWFKGTKTKGYYARHIAPLVNMEACKDRIAFCARTKARLQRAIELSYTTPI